ncbi:hypothetical protein SAMN05444128_3290 [Pontibacter indicus]|uniref:Preprotein translocase subunit SecE n=1 Tax=Pontibacter indicus TaxID=1317125 RepID=A0A1R3XPS8_9BACT|nr:hypothetical protein SAMN05444128_3290 [Pontibacter indicus]
MLTLLQPKSPKTKYRKKATAQVLKQLTQSDPYLEDKKFRRRIEWGAIGVSVVIFKLKFFLFGGADWLAGFIY